MAVQRTKIKKHQNPFEWQISAIKFHLVGINSWKIFRFYQSTIILLFLNPQNSLTINSIHRLDFVLIKTLIQIPISYKRISRVYWVFQIVTLLFHFYNNNNNHIDDNSPVMMNRKLNNKRLILVHGGLLKMFLCKQLERNEMHGNERKEKSWKGGEMRMLSAWKWCTQWEH